MADEMPKTCAHCGHPADSWAAVIWAGFGSGEPGVAPIGYCSSECFREEWERRHAAT
jgi:hypothetical protein